MCRLFILLFCVYLCVHSSDALPDEEMKAQFMRLIMKCAKTNPVEVNELMKLNNLIPPKKTEVKCLLACAYKTEGIMTKDGKYDLAHGYALAEIVRNGDEKRFQNAKKLAEMADELNKVEVSDGEKGCERAGMIFKITVENAPKMGFKI